MANCSMENPFTWLWLNAKKFDELNWKLNMLNESQACLRDEACPWVNPLCMALLQCFMLNRTKCHLKHDKVLYTPNKSCLVVFLVVLYLMVDEVVDQVIKCLRLIACLCNHVLVEEDVVKVQCLVVGDLEDLVDKRTATLNTRQMLETNLRKRCHRNPCRWEDQAFLIRQLSH